MAAMSMTALCSSTNANYGEVEPIGVLLQVAGRKSKKPAGTERSTHNIILSPSSSSSSSSPAAGCSRPSSASSQRWCKESLKAMETHLSLLQQSKATALSPAIVKLHHAPAGPLNNAAQLDLASHLHATSAQLPRGWEQHLDLRTGKIYYINWETCKRSNNDPRKALRSADEMINGLMQQAMNSALMAEGNDILNHEGELQSSVTQELNGVCGNSNNLNILQPCPSKDEEEMEVESKWNPNAKLDDRLSDELGRGSSDDMIYDSINIVPSLMRTCTRGHYRIATSNEPDAVPKLEALSCHHCLSHIIIHIANPWCPLCGLALV